jgi:hypothetical protein
MASQYEDKEFLEPWYFVVSDGSLEKELSNEVGHEHILYGRELVAVARKDGYDDVLFYFKYEPNSLAMVHITWKGKQEFEPHWPRTKVFDSWDEWMSQCMIPDNEEYMLE